MSQPSLLVIDSTGTQQAVFTQNPNGQTTSSNSQSVVLASDQSPLSVAGEFFQAIQPISTTSLPLPSGAATSANQASQLSVLETLSTAANQTSQLTVLETLATSANQTTANTSLATIATNSSGPNSTATGSLSTLASVMAIGTGAYSTVSIQITGTGVGFALTPQASMDGGTTWINVGVLAAGAGATSTSLTSITTNGNWELSSGAYSNVRLLNATAASSGTVVAYITANKADKIIRSSAIGDQSDVAATGGGTGAFSLVSLVKLALSNWTTLLAKIPTLGAAGKAASIPVTIATDQPAVPISGGVGIAAQTTGGYTYTHINTNTTTTVKSGAGTLHTVTINSLGASHSATLYDSLTGSGTVIGVVTTSTTQPLRYDIAFTTGLTIVTAGTTPADLTISYK